ncbi:MAG: hypothetical protein WAZ77_21130 [Candidatus Nitrosopolaris sp.]
MIDRLFDTSIVKLFAAAISPSAVPCTIYYTSTNSTMLGIDNCRSRDTLSLINIAKIDWPLTGRSSL